MTNVKKICSKCGKEIVVDKYEYCCPLCGEFFDDINNTKVIQHHEETEKLESLSNSIKQSGKKTNKTIFKVWFISLAILYPVLIPLAVKYSQKYKVPSISITSIIILIVITLVGPIILLINHFVHRKKLSRIALEVDTRILRMNNEKYAFYFSAYLGKFCSFAMAILILFGILLFIKPDIIFKYLNNKTIVLIMTITSSVVVILAILTMRIYNKKYSETEEEKKRYSMIKSNGCVSIVGSLISLILMIISLCSQSK